MEGPQLRKSIWINFMTGLNFSKEDFQNILQGKDSDLEKRAECIACLRKMAPSKLELIYKMVVNI